MTVQELHIFFSHIQAVTWPQKQISMANKPAFHHICQPQTKLSDSIFTHTSLNKYTLSFLHFSFITSLFFFASRLPCPVGSLTINEYPIH